MHTNRLRDVAQDQRAQVLHAFDEEQVLLANDLSCNLQNRVGPLVERLDQPVSGMKPLRDVFFFGLVADLVSVEVPGGRATVEIEPDTSWLSGPARTVFAGEIELPREL